MSLEQCLHAVSTVCLPQSAAELASCRPPSRSRGTMEVSVGALSCDAAPRSRCWGVSNGSCGRVHLSVVFSNSHG